LHNVNLILLLFRNSKWVLIAIAILFFAGLVVAATIVLSLIPLYLSKKTATLNEGNQLHFYFIFLFIYEYPLASSSFITLLYDISEGDLDVSLPINTLSAAALLYLQENVSNTIDSNLDLSLTSTWISICRSIVPEQAGF
jgi:hypothetical protein